MSDGLYIRVVDKMQGDGSGNTVPYKVAEVVLGGEVVARGEAPDIGAYKADNVAESSAISSAKIGFTRSCLTDIRRV